MSSWDGQVAAVTGSRGAIGAAIVAQLSALDVRVSGGDLAASADDGIPPVDVTSSGSVETWLDGVESRLGPLSIGVVCAGISRPGRLVDSSDRDWGDVVAGYENGTFDSGIVWSANAPTPYQFYRGVMSTETVKPVGEQTFDNYHRFGSADADALLDQFAAASDEATQQSVMNELQALFAETAPVAPLFPGPEWGAASTARFTGWPTEDDPYATLSTRARAQTRRSARRVTVRAR